MRRIGDGRVRWLPQAGRGQLDESNVVQSRGGVAGIAVVSRWARITIAAGIWIDPRMGHLQQKLVLVDVISDYLVVNFRCNSATAQDKRFSFVKISSAKWFSRARAKNGLVVHIEKHSVQFRIGVQFKFNRCNIAKLGDFYK